MSFRILPVIEIRALFALGTVLIPSNSLDVYGEVIFAAYTYAADGGIIDNAGARMLAGLGEVVRSTWREPDSGIWEVRGPRRHFTFSKVMCWTALDRLIALEKMGVVKLGKKLRVYEAERAAIANLIETRGFNSEIQAYTGELDGDQVDASVLLMPSVGYRDAQRSSRQIDLRPHLPTTGARRAASAL